MFLAAWEENFDKILAEFTVGDPMREGVLWTNLCRPEISRRFALMGTLASRHVVRKLLKKSHLGQRKSCKKKSMGTPRTAPLRTHRAANAKSKAQTLSMAEGSARRPCSPQNQNTRSRLGAKVNATPLKPP